MDTLKPQRGTCFEVSRTPPDIKRKRQKEKDAKMEEIVILQLAPFSAHAVVMFEDIKLGDSAVRKLAIRNPKSTQTKVTLERLPNKEKGFVFEFVEFELGPEEEAVVQIGWVPQNGTPLRETILAKFGKFHTQIKINATGIAPIQKKKTTFSRPPLRPANIRTNARQNVEENSRKKDTKVAIVIPKNPITQQPNGTKPPITYFNKENKDPQGGSEVRKRSPDKQINEPCDGAQANTRKDVQPFRDFVASGMSTSNRFTPERRQTFVKHDGNHFQSDIISNIQIVSSNIEPSEVGSFTPERRQTYVKNHLDVSEFPIDIDSSREKVFEINDSLNLPDYILSLTTSTPPTRPTKEIPEMCKLADSIQSQLYYTQLTTATKKAEPTTETEEPFLNMSLNIDPNFIAFSPEAATITEKYTDKAVSKTVSLDDGQEEETIGGSDADNDVSGCEYSIMESNQEQKQLNFLLDTIREEDFIPPDPESKKYSSTAHKKDRSRNNTDEYSISSQVREKSSEMKRELFSILKNSNHTEDNEENHISPVALKNDKELDTLDFTNSSLITMIASSLEKPAKNGCEIPLNFEIVGEGLYGEGGHDVVEAYDQLDIQEPLDNENIQPTDADPGIKDSSRETYIVDSRTIGSLEDVTEEKVETDLKIVHLTTKNECEKSKNSENVDSKRRNVEVDAHVVETNIPSDIQEPICKEHIPSSGTETHAKDSSRETYVVDGRTIGSLEDITEERELAGIEIGTDVLEDEPKPLQLTQGQYQNEFLLDTITETDFVPPNPQNHKYCSTARKKDRSCGEQNQSPTTNAVEEKSSKIRLDIFGKNSIHHNSCGMNANKEYNSSSPLTLKNDKGSETWSIPINASNDKFDETFQVGTEKACSNPNSDINTQRITKLPTNLTNRVSLFPSSSSTNLTKSITKTVSKVPTKNKPINQRLTLIKHVKNSNMIHHPNPHAANNMYYDERWIEKQENGFKKWLNFVLTPPEGFDDAASQSDLLKNGKLDVAKLWSACTKDVKVPRAPTRETLSLRAYSVQKEMNTLRRNACLLMQSPDVANILEKLEVEVEKHRFEIRKDKAINKDVGLKKNFLMLILNYNPLWLRIGLETVFGRIIQMHEAADIVTLSKFVIGDFLTNPDILSQFAHSTVPHHYVEGYEIKLKQFMLKKFFNLVYFLDQAKKTRLIKHNPCLFCKDSPIKMSKNIITTFSSEYLSGEGDVMKHLGYLGYKVSHEQTYFDEFDYAVTNIATDLRSGVRLSRLMEILTKEQGLINNLRIPKTVMQKKHNVGIALEALAKSAAGPPPEKTSSKEIVDGHMQKTLDLLWHVIFGFQIGQLLSVEKLFKEIEFLEKTLNHEVRTGNKRATAGWYFYLETKRRELQGHRDQKDDTLMRNEKIVLLLRWARLVCAHYGLEIENFSVSFSDGRGLCLLMHHYHPAFLPMEEISMETTQTQEGLPNGANNGDGSFNDSFGRTMTCSFAKSSDYAGNFERLLKNEKNNFKVIHNKTKELGGVPILIKSSEMSNTIPDQKVTTTFITYMAARLLDLSVDMQAARIIQLAWKRFLVMKNERLLKVRYKAASQIQQCVRKYLCRRRKARYRIAATTIQSAVRGYLARKAVQNLRTKLRYEKKLHAIQFIQKIWRRRLQVIVLRRQQEKAALILQKNWRCHIIRKQYLLYQRRVKATICIQTNWRTWKASRKLMEQRCATIIIQSCFRGFITRKKFILIKNAVSLVQSFWRTKQAERRYCKLKIASIIIQSNFRCLVARRNYQKERNAAVTLQKNWRCFTAQQTKRKEISAIVTLQKYWRRTLAIRHKEQKLKQIVVVQSHVKRYQKRKLFLKQKEAAVVIQSFWRSKLALQSFHNLRVSAILIQAHWRRYYTQKRFKDYKKAILTVQSHVRKWQAQVKKTKKIGSIILLQSLFRSHIQRRKYLMLKDSVIKMQAFWKRNLQLRKYQKMRTSILLIQKLARGMIVRKSLKGRNQAAIKIQNYFRKYLMAKEAKQKRAATIVQSFYRMLVERKKYQQHLVRKQAVTTLQRYYRGYLARKYKQNVLSKVVFIQAMVRKVIRRREYLVMKKTAITLQSLWRAKKEVERFKLLKSSVLILQKNWRGTVARRSFCEFKCATIIIQKNIRSHLAVRYKNRKLKAIIMIQNFLRCHTTRKRYLKYRLAAIILQKNWKTHQAQMMKRKSLKAIISLQSIIRSHIQRKRFLKHKSAAVTIQSMWRSKMARKSYESKRKSAIIIQTLWRSRDASEKYKQMKKCTTIIQKNWRSYVQRKSYQQKRHAAVVLQKYIRRRQAMKNKYCQLNAVVVIQKYFRRYKEQSCYQKIRWATITLQKNWKTHQAQMTKRKSLKAIISLQSNIRSHIQRKSFLKEKSAAITIQSMWRSKMARKSYESKRKSAIIIQTLWRSRDASEKYKHLKKCTTVIQKNWRSYGQRKTYQRKRHAAVVLQKYIRRRQAMKNKYCKLNAVVVIQKYFRRYKEQSCYQKIRWAAITLQKNWKTHQAQMIKRKSLMAIILLQSNLKSFVQRKIYLKEKSAALSIQSMWRRKMAQRSFQSKRKSAVILQTLWRSKTASRKYKLLKGCATVIQKNWRSYAQRKSYQQKRQAAVVLQKYIRRHQAIKAKNCQLNAVIVIQKYLRRYQEQKCYQKIQWAAITLQKSWKRHQAQMASKTKMKSVIVLQSFAKSYLQRKKFLKSKHAAIIIQKSWRIWMENMANRKMIAAMKIQSYVRMIIQRKKYRRHLQVMGAIVIIQNQYRRWIAIRERRRQIKCIVKVQSLVRTFITLKRYHKLRSAAAIIQAHWKAKALRLKRSRQIRQTYLKESAAKVIQHFMKGSMTRLKYRRTIKAATCIQSYWRGYKQRQVKEAWCKRIKEIRERIRNAKINAIEENKLYRRTISALNFLYTSKDMAYLIKVIRDLEFATRYSTSCCVRLIENNGLPLSILADLAERCNRSLPHMEVVTNICDILISTSELEETRHFIATWDKSSKIFKTIFHLMYQFKENKKPMFIFSKCCSFLWKLCHSKTAAQILNTTEYSEKLLGFEKDAKKQKSRLQSTSSGSSLQNYTPFRGRSNTAPTSTKKSNVNPLKKLDARHGAAELSPNIVRFHEEYQIAITTLNKKIKRSSMISE